jgi:beta-glucanase (GH16 family)
LHFVRESKYLDPRSGGEKGPLAEITPFTVQDGMLSITARPTPPGFISHAEGLPYLSGMLNTAKTFSFTYGYIEVRARIPQGRGLWPAIWLLPGAGGWPPEIDVMEAMGHNTNRYFGSLHTRQHGFSIEAVNMIETPDLSKEFGIYGLKWTAQEIEWYFNGKKVASAKTPPDLNQPMYLLLNLAVGGSWAGVPDVATRFPANFDIDYIRIYAP